MYSCIISSSVGSLCDNGRNSCWLIYSCCACSDLPVTNGSDVCCCTVCTVVGPLGEGKS